MADGIISQVASEIGEQGKKAANEAVSQVTKTVVQTPLAQIGIKNLKQVEEEEKKNDAKKEVLRRQLFNEAIKMGHSPSVPVNRNETQSQEVPKNTLPPLGSSVQPGKQNSLPFSVVEKMTKTETGRSKKG